MFCFRMNMQINSSINYNKIKSINFKGFEARKLKAIVTNGCYGDDVLIDELKAIANQNGIMLRDMNRGSIPWSQDFVLVNSDGEVIGNDNYVGRFSWLKGLNLRKINSNFIDGGNYFQVRNKKGERVLLSGAFNFIDDGRKKEIYKKNNYPQAQYKDFFKCDRLVKIPQVDFHIDLFLTPIGDNKIFLCDDNLTVKYMEEMIKKAKDFVNDKENSAILRLEFQELLTRLEGFLQQFKINMQIAANNFNNGSAEPVASLSDVENILKDEGFEVIKIPGRIYSCEYCSDRHFLSHDLNYANAITFKNKDNEVVILTNKSKLNEQMGITPEISEILGLDFEKMFIDSVKGHIKPENIYFLEGSRLPEELKYSHGGLHCISLEVPDFSSEI